MEKQESGGKKRKKLPSMPKLRVWPRILLYIAMVVFATLALISAAYGPEKRFFQISIYVCAAATLFPGCWYLFFDIRYGVKDVIRTGIAANPYTSRVAADYGLRTVVFAVPGVVSNIVFAIFNGVVGLVSHSAWFGSLAAYYILLCVMRLGAVQQARQLTGMSRSRDRVQKEIIIYRKNSILFILMAAVLGGMVVLLVLSQGGKNYPGLTIYAAAAYTFYRIIHSSINVVRVRKQNSPLLTIIRKIGYIDACVSILTLQSAMFASFGGDQKMLIRVMNGMTGGVVCLIVFAVGIQGILAAGKMSRRLAGGEEAAWERKEEDLEKQTAANITGGKT